MKVILFSISRGKHPSTPVFPKPEFQFLVFDDLLPGMGYGRLRVQYLDKVTHPFPAPQVQPLTWASGPCQGKEEEQSLHPQRRLEAVGGSSSPQTL